MGQFDPQFNGRVEQFTFTRSVTSLKGNVLARNLIRVKRGGFDQQHDQIKMGQYDPPH